MIENMASKLKSGQEAWRNELRQFKEALAKRIWAIPGVSEKEKELMFQGTLRDLDQFEQDLAEVFTNIDANMKGKGEENDLLRSLLGLEQDELKAKILTMGHDLRTAQTKRDELESQVEQAVDKLNNSEMENKELRKTVRELEQKIEQIQIDHGLARQFEIKRYSEANVVIQKKARELESRLGNLRELFNETNEKLLIEKQEEISILQKKLLEEMEDTLRRKQELAWGEEEMFARGVAHKVRAALVSLQGQLFLSLERLGLMDSESKNESFWKARLKLLVEGAGELSAGFKNIQKMLHNVTSTLDEYLHLTHRRALIREPVSIKECIQHKLADLYLDRRPTLDVQVLIDDPLPDVMGDKELLQFVMDVLIQNAVEALPNESGSVIIAVNNQSDVGQLRLSIKDTGRGIAEHLLPRLFEPFFTTKEGRQGLNLSRAKRYIELHGGEITLVKSDASGTHFDIKLSLEGSR